MARPFFTDTLHCDAADGSLHMEPSPYIKGEALVTPKGHRALRLLRSMTLTRSGAEQFHVTPVRAHKLFELFFRGFDAQEHGARDYMYVRGASKPMSLADAMNVCRAMDVK